MRNVNSIRSIEYVNEVFGFILTMRNVNTIDAVRYGMEDESFILTMRNVNKLSTAMRVNAVKVLY